MEGTPPAGSPPPSQPSTMLPALVVVGALVGFALLLFLANFSMTTSTQQASNEPDKPFNAFNTKAKGKGAKGKVSKLPEEKLLVNGPARTLPEAPANAKNVVVVIMSTARKDQFTPYGADPKITPFLQDVASKGARFADALTTSPFARSAVTGMLTGRYPTGIDMVVPGPGPESGKTLKDEFETLAERLAAGGWQTYGATANFHRNTDTGLAQGFDKYRNSQPGGYNPAVRTNGGKLVAIALDMLNKRSDEDAKHPFYLQVDLVDPQGPIPMVPEQMEEFDDSKPNAAYRSVIHQVDLHIKALMEELATFGHTIDKNTYLVVISDHGEGLLDPEHHGRAHGVLLYESSVAIPWIVAGPDIPTNRIIGGLASGVDLMPTVLGLVGLAPPEGIDGISWAPQLKGEGERTTRDRVFSDTWWSTANRASIWTERMQCQKDYGSTGIDDTFATGCYDRITDPEFRDLKQDAALLAELDTWRALVSKAVTEVAEPSDGAQGEAPDGATPETPDGAPAEDAHGADAQDAHEEELPEPGEQAG